MQSAVERIQSKEEVAGDAESLVGLVSLAAVHAHVCSQFGLDKKLTKTVLDLHHKVCCAALPCPALPCPQLCQAVCSSRVAAQSFSQLHIGLLGEQAAVCDDVHSQHVHTDRISQSRMGMSACAGQLSLPLSLPCGLSTC